MHDRIIDLCVVMYVLQVGTPIEYYLSGRNIQGIYLGVTYKMHSGRWVGLRIIRLLSRYISLQAIIGHRALESDGKIRDVPFGIVHRL